MSSRARLAVASLTLLLGVSACASGSGQQSAGSGNDRGASSSPIATRPATQDSQTGAGASPSASAGITSKDTRSQDIVDNPPASTWQQALSKAQDRFEGRPAKIELERDDSGRLHYKVEILSQSQKQAVQYDAGDLSELSHKVESLGSDAAKKQKETFDVGSLVPLDKAVKAARGHQAGTVNSWKLEGKDTGRVQYEFDIRPSGQSEDVEVQVNAEDGSVITGS